MEIQQLKGFLSVAKYKGFSQAAQKTFRTQPAISLQIKSLEEELGARLFDRLGPKKVELTEEGKMFYEIVSPLLGDLESLKARFNEQRGAIHKGHIKIATHTSVMIYLLPEVIQKFKKKFPDCEISIVNRGRNEIIEMLNNGDIDFGICSLKEIPSTIEYNVFARFKRFLITSKNHPLSKKPTVILKDIVQYPLIVPPLGSNTRSIIDAIMTQNDFKYQVAMEITGREAIKTYVSMDFGVSIINGFYITDDDKKNIFIKDVSKFFGTAERGILKRKGRFLLSQAREFEKMVLKWE